MTFVDRYPAHLDAVGNEDELYGVDRLLYRLAFTRLAVAGLPDAVDVGPARVHFTSGPLRTQVTEVRQRHGVPFVFDKHMRRGMLVGEGELVTVVEIEKERADDLARAMAEGREVAEAALGLVCAMLDERVVRHELAEDMLLLAGGAPVAAVDMHAYVRTFMPFDVRPEDAAALEQLSEQDASSDQPVGRSASLYMAGVREGPTRLGFLLLWLAIDALVGTRKTQKNAVALALAGTGFDQEWLALSLGRLVGLRGNVAHGRVDDFTLLRKGFYDSEGIARALIRHRAGVEGGWPTLPTVTAFPLPTANQLAPGNWSEEWHDEGLPPAEPRVEPAGLERFDAARGEHAKWLQVTGAPDGMSEARLRFWTLDAIDALGVEIGVVAVVVTTDLPQEHDIAVNAERILVSSRVASPVDEIGEVSLAYLLCEAVAQMLVMRAGVGSRDFGAFLIAFAGTWAGYTEWVRSRDMPADFLTHPPLDKASLQEVGAVAGAALAGDETASVELSEWIKNDDVDADVRSLVDQTIQHLAPVDEFRSILEFVTQLVEATTDIEPRSDRP